MAFTFPETITPLMSVACTFVFLNKVYGFPPSIGVRFSRYTGGLGGRCEVVGGSPGFCARASLQYTATKKYNASSRHRLKTKELRLQVRKVIIYL